MIPLSYILANLAIFLAALVQASAGIGFAMIAVPLLLMIDLAFVPAPVLIVMGLLAVFMSMQEWRHVDWQGMTALLPGMVLGTLLAAYVLKQLDPALFGLVFGSILLLALAIVGLGRPMPRRPAFMAAGGLVSGLMGTISGIHGPALAVLYHGMELAAVRATIAVIFVISTITALGFLSYQGFAGLAEWQRGLGLLPGLVLGLPAASLIRGRIPVHWLRRGMLSLVGLSACLLIYRSLSAE